MVTMTKPIEVKRADNSLTISWSDGVTSVLPTETLRRACPCAECKMKRGDDSHDRPIATKKSKSRLTIVDSTLEEATVLEQIWPVGNYALGLRWSDGHSTGIYPYSLLAELGRSSQGWIISRES